MCFLGGIRIIIWGYTRIFSLEKPQFSILIFHQHTHTMQIFYEYAVFYFSKYYRKLVVFKFYLSEQNLCTGKGKSCRVNAYLRMDEISTEGLFQIASSCTALTHDPLKSFIYFSQKILIQNTLIRILNNPEHKNKNLMTKLLYCTNNGWKIKRVLYTNSVKKKINSC